MTINWFLILCEITVISTALASGIFLTFSDFVMRSLKMSNPSSGIEVMQVINAQVWRSIFMKLLFGNLALTTGLAGLGYFNYPGTISILLGTGAVLYVIGVFLVTFTTNVPMNEHLDTFDFSSRQAETYWQTYVPRWTFWNYIRAILTSGTAICFLAASTLLAQV